MEGILAQFVFEIHPYSFVFVSVLFCSALFYFVLFFELHLQPRFLVFIGGSGLLCKILHNIFFY